MKDQIKLEDDTKKRKRQKMPMYVTAAFIALSGVGILLFTVYYIAFLPVPTVMQPLRVRVLTTLQLEQALEEDLELVIITTEESPLDTYERPDEEAEVVTTVSDGGVYEKIDEEEGWVKIRDEEKTFEAWLGEGYVRSAEDFDH